MHIYMQKSLVALSFSVFLLGAGSADATTIDLTTAGTSGTLNGALFEQGGTLSGTGRFPAFVQIASNADVTDAYNTRVNDVNDNGSSNTFNHEITLATVPVQTIGLVDYYSFFLDINEEGNDSDKYLSLDNVMIFTSTVANQSSEPLPVGTLRYNMDAGSDNTVLLNFDLEPGSGRADMELLVPTSLFTGALGSNFVYLYSIFGGVGTNPGAGFPAGNYAASDGFEEWARGTGTFEEPPPPPPPDIDSVPEPASLLLVGSGLAAAAAARRRRRQS